MYLTLNIIILQKLTSNMAFLWGTLYMICSLHNGNIQILTPECKLTIRLLT